MRCSWSLGYRQCVKEGLRNRTPMLETLMFGREVRDAILSNLKIADLRKAAGEWTYQTLMESGCRKVVDGTTTLEEVERVAARE